MSDLASIISILNRTPDLLFELCKPLPNNLLFKNEGELTWSTYDIIGHLIHGERTDWIPRMEIILSDSEDKTFTTFDRFAQFEDSKNKSLENLLNEFSELRENNVLILSSYDITEVDLIKKGIHPEFGEVTLSMLLNTWATHDLNHIAQISRVLAYQFKDNVGPWRNYLGIIKK